MKLITRRTYACLLAGVSALAASRASADEVVTGNKTIYNGNELSGFTWLDGGHLRYGTVDVEDTLQGELIVGDGDTGALSVTPTSTIHVNFRQLLNGSTLNLGTATDTGKIIVDHVQIYGASDPTKYNINGGTVVANAGLFLDYHEVGIFNGATLEMGATSRASLVNLHGDGTFVANGADVNVFGGLFDGTIQNVGALSFRQISLMGVPTSATAALRGRLIDVGSLYVGGPITLDTTDSDIAADLSLIGSIGVDGTMDLGLNDATLHNLSGAGLIGTAGKVTVAYSNYAGQVQAGQGITFIGNNNLSGALIGNVDITAGASLFTTNASAFNSATALTVDGSYWMQEGTTVGTLVGSGSINLGFGEALSIVGNAASNFSGRISGGGSLIKDGTGTLTLSGANTYFGGTTILAGTLIGDTNSIQRNIANYSGVLQFDQAFDGEFSGNIIGMGRLVKSGTGELKLTGQNGYFGGTTISGGALSVSSNSITGNIVNNATLIFDQDFNGAFAGDISGTGDFEKRGSGKLTWTGDGTYTGATDVVEGTLSVNGSLLSQVTIHDGAFLGGNGTIASFSASGGGTVGPGNSIGTLTVAGNADFHPGSIYAVEVDGAGRSDLINVGGILTIAPTAGVAVRPENGIDTGVTYSSPLTYTIATAAGGVSGAFGSVTDSFAFLTSSLSYDPTNVYLTLTRIPFSSPGGTTNETGVGGAIDTIGPGALSDALLFVTDDEREAALRSLSGEIHASLQRSLVDESSRYSGAALSHLFDERSGPFWSVAYGGRSHYAANDDASGFNGSGGGLIMGADLVRTEEATTGLMAGYSNASANLDQTPSSATINGVHFGAYGALRLEDTSVRFGGLWSGHDIATRRKVEFTSLSETLTADYDATTSQAFVEAAQRLTFGDLDLEPFVNGTLVYQNTPSFEEDGGVAALHGQADSILNTFLTVGTRFDQALVDEKARLFGEVGWRHLFGEPSSSAVVAFDGSQDFSITGVTSARDSAFVKLGARVQLTSSFSADLSYDGSFSSGPDSHSIKTGLSLSF
ncbi:autotransporter-associated beta strand protein [Rhizobium sp. BK650]|uniref:autotransporter outer membrane beta-barrel domain-containing protein n=1 Tax=Rhizobium sp. BK650 TaxID=2586990 RepID=UPI00161F4470|nr:autotransporter domain-containing protein [Rhizobium sp. BK650]MBB3656733.1 autotransporter-associated beta strand protein [Rhizobium sp. BK650]